MALEDMEKTFFITPWGMYCYKVMPFGLKNAGATYQRAFTTLLHDLIHKEVEVYVDDMIVKSKDRKGYIPALQKFFERIQFYKLRLSPKKCTFGITSEKLLGFMKRSIHHLKRHVLHFYGQPKNSNIRCLLSRSYWLQEWILWKMGRQLNEFCFC